jgi:hypothetical protein
MMISIAASLLGLLVTARGERSVVQAKS